MSYWPGTKIPKSTGNAFDWQKSESQITKQVDFKNTNNAKKYMLGQTESKFFSTFSKAKSSKCTETKTS